MGDKFFYNGFVSKILFNLDGINDNQACERKLERVAIVNVEMTGSDVIHLEKTVQGSISGFTTIGGLLSLYAGFSFLSLAEVSFWTLRILVRLSLRIKE